MVYQVEAVEKCIRDGLLECPDARHLSASCPGAKSRVVVSPFHKHQFTPDISWRSKCPSKIWSWRDCETHTITYHQLFIAWVGRSHLYCSDVSEITVLPCPLHFNGMGLDHWMGRCMNMSSHGFTVCFAEHRLTMTYIYIVFISMYTCVTDVGLPDLYSSENDRTTHPVNLEELWTGLDPQDLSPGTATLRNIPWTRALVSWRSWTSIANKLVWHTPPRPPTAVCLERSALEWGPELDHVAKLLPWFGYLQKGHSAGKMRKTLGINGNHMRWCRSPKPSMGRTLPHVDAILMQPYWTTVPDFWTPN